MPRSLSALFHLTLANQLSALFTQSADNWFLLNLGAGWEPGRVRTVVAKDRRGTTAQLQGFQCVYRKTEPCASTVVLSQEHLESGAGYPNTLDETMMEIVARTVHALTSETGQPQLRPNWPPQQAEGRHMVIAGNEAVVHYLPGIETQIEVAVALFAGRVVVIAAQRCSPVQELISELRPNLRLTVSADGVISEAPSSSPTESSES